MPRRNSKLVLAQEAKNEELKKELEAPELPPIPDEVEEEKPKPKGKSKKCGSRDQVWNGEALKTKGGLTKKDLCLNKNGKVVSKKQSERGKQLAANLKKSKAKKTKK